MSSLPLSVTTGCSTPASPFLTGFLPTHFQRLICPFPADSFPSVAASWLAHLPSIIATISGAAAPHLAHSSSFPPFNWREWARQAGTGVPLEHEIYMVITL